MIVKEVEEMDDRIPEFVGEKTQLNYVVTELDDNPAEVNNRVDNKVLDYYIESASEDEFVFNSQRQPTKFKSESFLKTFKTLVDISTEPLLDECYSLSSSGSEDSEDSESFSLIPKLSSLSNKFIKHTTSLFNNSQDNLVDTQLDDDEVGQEGDQVNEEKGKEWNIEGIAKWF
ncbi:uncharacterized protein TA07305 [Theileria annulata]|uniref:Uncharacterized protein n=1 Tax=Theileria annulata TaxID=5874 RepID=Q4UA84_THEAN|nr:uncharacterized protein TA07305 [Theileria annulata]CAI76269.1 hypothetical protein TA07305 [Theileria annulata]|eukprot:XP_952893.1 hypothetical protein TA07305 [Theileria annulata]